MNNNIKHNAVVLLVFNNPKYITGACISAFVHRYFIKQSGKDIKIVLMVDEKIYALKKIYKKFFDEIYLVPVLEIKLNKNYIYSKKYKLFMKYIVTKWNSLSLIKYNKVLFMDIDVLSISPRLYNVFELNTPAFHFVYNMTYNLNLNNLDILDFFKEGTNIVKNVDYKTISTKLLHCLDAGFVLLKPDMIIYNEYLDFLKICDKGNGFTSAQFAAPDETTLFLFYTVYKKMRFYKIDKKYSIIPWDQKNIKSYKVFSLNFLSRIKPWLKHPLIEWEDERVWIRIGNKIFKKKTELNDIFQYNIFYSLWDFVNNLNKYNKEKSPYNLEFLSNPKTKHLLVILNEKLKNKNIEDFNIKEMKEFNKYLEKFVKYLDKKKIMNFNTSYL